MFFEFQNALRTNNIDFCLNEPMKLHTSFRIGGSADVFITPDSSQKCCKAISLCNKFDVPFVIIGKGSNLLVSDSGYRGAVICISNLISDITLIENTKIKCGAGVLLSNVCNFALQNELTGMEFAYGIPGSCGGAVVMNAGAYGGEMKDIVSKCEYVDLQGNLCSITADNIDFSYRRSFFSDKPFCITDVVLELKKGEANKIRETMTELLNRRKEKQPLEFPSAGSTFKRPEGSYASMLIDKCGLKGFRVGDAQVSEKHAGFVINRGNATCTDVLTLIEKITKIVLDETGFKLEPEIKII